jgi:hypothetical protein
MNEAFPEARSETLEKNLSFLARHFPSLRAKLDREEPEQGDFALLPAVKPNILYRGRPYHAPRDAEREALSLVDGLLVRQVRVLIFLGIGMGYHIETFRRLYGSPEGITLVGIERSLAAFALLLRSRDISFLEGVTLFVGERAETVEACFESLSPLRFAGYRIIRLRGACAPFADYYRRLETSFRTAMAGKLSDVLTRLAFESLWMKNIVGNVAAMVGRNSIRALTGALAGKPALVVGAGPSLLDRPRSIRRLASSVCTIAVDTALDTLLGMGVTPDYVVTLDAQFHNLHDFTDVFSGKGESASMTLVADLACYTQIPRRWNGNIFFSASAFDRAGGDGYELHPLVEKLKAVDETVEALPCGGSVATTALELAVKMGADPIYVAGLDLAYTRLLTHAASSAPYHTRLRSSSRFDPLLTSMSRSIAARPLRQAQGVSGGPVLTDFVFLSYRHWIAERAEFRGRVFTVAENGLEIPGIGRASIEDAIKAARAERGSRRPGHKGHRRPQPPPSLRGVPVFGKESALLFLGGLEDEAATALREVNSMARTKPEVGVSLRHPFLGPILAEAEALYREPKAVNAHLAAFLTALGRWVERARERVSRGAPPRIFRGAP